MKRVVLDTNCLLASISSRSEFFIVWRGLHEGRYIRKDPDDNKFVDCAFAANAAFIVSNDHHFDVLESIDFPKILVLRLQQFAALLKK